MAAFRVLKFLALIVLFDISDAQQVCTTHSDCRSVSRCPNYLAVYPQVHACLYQDDGTKKCGCVPECLGSPTSVNGRTCLPEQIIACTLQNKLSKCESVQNYFQVGCICTSKCSTVEDCSFLNPNCNLGNNFLTCSNGACSCTPKQCKQNADCTGSCPVGQKSFCPYSSYKCECVPDDYCDYDADCPVCPGQKRYCGKYDKRDNAGGGYMEVNKCTCLNTEQCQENGDCGTGKCCSSVELDSDPITGKPRNPVHFGTCYSEGTNWFWYPVIGCPHDNKHGIESK